MLVRVPIESHRSKMTLGQLQCSCSVRDMLAQRCILRASRSLRLRLCPRALVDHEELLLRQNLSCAWLNGSNFPAHAPTMRAIPFTTRNLSMNFRCSAAVVEAQPAKKEATKPVIDLPTSDDNEELLRIRHSVCTKSRFALCQNSSHAALS